jgi:hypothetical protein
MSPYYFSCAKYVFIDLIENGLADFFKVAILKRLQRKFIHALKYFFCCNNLFIFHQPHSHFRQLQVAILQRRTAAMYGFYTGIILRRKSDFKITEHSFISKCITMKHLKHCGNIDVHHHIIFKKTVVRNK